VAAIIRKRAGALHCWGCYWVGGRRGLDSADWEVGIEEWFELGLWSVMSDEWGFLFCFLRVGRCYKSEEEKGEEDDEDEEAARKGNLLSSL
jgi:hypothetical protein